MQPQLLILAGPNGAGKTTCSAKILGSDVRFINADHIAEKARANEIEAGRMTLDAMRLCLDKRQSFVIEATLSGRWLVSKLESIRALGYAIHVFFVWLPSADIAIERVAKRVRSGGHAIPEQTIRRRYSRGLENLWKVIELVDTWSIYSNEDIVGPKLIANGARGERSVVNDKEAYEQIEKGK